MRRNAVQLARRLCLTEAGSTQGVAVAASSLLGLPAAAAPLACSGVGAAAAASAAGSGASAAAAASQWRPFNASAAAAASEEEETSAPAQQQAPAEGGRPARHPHRSAVVRRVSPAKRNYRSVDPDSALGRLVACLDLAEMRAWREAETAQGAFNATALAAAIRVVVQARRFPHHAAQPTPHYPSIPRPEVDAYLRELLQLAAGMTLDGKAAAYLLWGPAKMRWSGKDPDVQAVLPLVYGQLDNMQGNDVASTLWALGQLGIQPSLLQRDQLLARLQPLLAGMRLKDLAAAATGAVQLTNLPFEFGQAVVEAFEERMAAGDEINPLQLENLVRLLPQLPGVTGTSLMAGTVFGEAVSKARHLPLMALADTVTAASKLRYPISDDALKRLLAAAQSRLPENKGPAVQALLYGLVQMRQVAGGEGPVSDAFIEACARRQVEVSCRGRGNQGHAYRFLTALSKLRATAVPEQYLQAMLTELQAGGLANLQRPWVVQMAFKRLHFRAGVDALEPFTHYHAQQQEQQGGDAEGQEKLQEQQGGDTEGQEKLQEQQGGDAEGPEKLQEGVEQAGSMEGQAQQETEQQKDQ